MGAAAIAKSRAEIATIEQRHRPLSWVAVRRGTLFCAPACGRGCTVVEHRKALTAARGLARKLGRGWQAVVHENLGWYPYAFSPCGRIKVSIHRDYGERRAHYTAFFGEPDGIVSGRWVETSSFPDVAVRLAVGAARRDLRKTQGMLRGLPAVVR